MSYGLLLLRLVVGLTFMTHGSQKLFGAFGGLGPHGTAEYFGSLRFRAPLVMVFVAGVSEIAGGVLLASGLLTPVAALVITVLMLTAIWADLRHQGYYVRNGGAEYAVLISTVAVAITMIGPGRFSLDAAIGWADNISGLWWGLGVLGLSVLISAVTLVAGRRPIAASDVTPHRVDDAAPQAPATSSTGE